MHPVIHIFQQMLQEIGNKLGCLSLAGQQIMACFGAGFAIWVLGVCSMMPAPGTCGQSG